MSHYSDVILVVEDAERNRDAILAVEVSWNKNPMLGLATTTTKYTSFSTYVASLNYFEHERLARALVAMDWGEYADDPKVQEFLLITRSEGADGYTVQDLHALRKWIAAQP